MKNYTKLVLSMVCCLSLLTGCGDDNNSSNQATTSNQTASNQTAQTTNNNSENVPATPFVATEEGTSSLKATGSVVYSFKEEQPEEWPDSVTSVFMKKSTDAEFTSENEIPFEKYSLTTTKLLIDSDLLPVDIATTDDYEIVLVSDDGNEFNLALSVTNYVPDTFTIRSIDGNGEVVESFDFSYDEMVAMSVNDEYYSSGCVMHGLTSFQAKGVYLSELFEKSGIEFSEGMSLAIRATDATTSIEATETLNSVKTGEIFDNPEQYWMKPRYTDNFKRTYEELYMQEAYFCTTPWEDEAVMNAGIEDAGIFDFEFREMLANPDYLTAVEPMIALTYTELQFNSIQKDPRTYELETSELTATERAFRFISGLPLDLDTTITQLSYDEDFGGYPVVETPEYEGLVAMSEGADPCGYSARNGMLIFGIDIFIEG